jgi:hypothetical protein
MGYGKGIKSPHRTYLGDLSSLSEDIVSIYSLLVLAMGLNTLAIVER